jgi:hypothetical protein
MAVRNPDARPQPHANKAGEPSDPWGSERRAREVVEMVIALWIFAIVACCALCVWGIATAVRRSNERRAHAVRH